MFSGHKNNPATKASQLNNSELLTSIVSFALLLFNSFQQLEISKNMHLIRPATDSTNWNQLADVFNHFVDTSTAAYPTKHLTASDFRDGWKSNPDFPYYEVIDTDTKKLAGFSFMRPFHPADSMAHAVLLIYFLSPSHTGKGIGAKLLDRLVEDGRKMGKTHFFVNISSENNGSIRFHQKHGFEECGRFMSVGNKFRRSFDMVWMQRIEPQ